MLALIRESVRETGALRNLLHATALISTLLMPFANAPDYSANWDLFFSGILPATAPILVIVIGLDIMMCSIWRSDTADAAGKARWTRIIRAHLVVGGLLLAAFLVVFLPKLV